MTRFLKMPNESTPLSSESGEVNSSRRRLLKSGGALIGSALLGGSMVGLAQAQDDGTTTTADEETMFGAEVWADNWFSIYVNGQLVGEDSVPITTERSFNAEVIEFSATYPLTIGIEAKDFKETDSGLEYIGTHRQQMGDGGIVAQITERISGEVIAVTNDEWNALVIHRAPLNPDCVDDPDPDVTCEFESTEAPDDWMAADFDDSDWNTATIWSAADVQPKEGYEEIAWDESAELIWGSDLELDNTLLLRLRVDG